MMNYVDFLYNWVENLDYSLKKLKYKHTESGDTYEKS